jgi:hypothetical protein
VSKGRNPDRSYFLGEGETNEDIAEQMKSKKKKQNTQDNYATKQKQLLSFVIKNKDDLPNETQLLDEIESLRIPFGDEGKVLKKFFGNIMSSAAKRNKCQNQSEIPAGEPDPWSVAQIKGFRSAIVSLYSDINQELSREVDLEIGSMIDGYEKMILDLKRRGLMKVEEGADLVA